MARSSRKRCGRLSNMTIDGTNDFCPPTNKFFCVCVCVWVQAH